MSKTRFAVLAWVSLFGGALGCGGETSTAPGEQPPGIHLARIGIARSPGVDAGGTGDAHPDAGGDPHRDAGTPGASEVDAGRDDAGAGASGGPVEEACTAGWVLDGGSVPEASLAATRARAKALRTVEGFDQAEGCEVELSERGELRWIDRYDPAGALLSRTTFLPDGGQAVFQQSWDGGRLISATEADGGTTTWTYDAEGRVLSRSQPGASERWQYGADGQLVELGRREADGGEWPLLTFGYDDQGRLNGSAYHWPGEGQGAAQTVVDLERYADGGISRYRDHALMATYGWDADFHYREDGQLESFLWGLDESATTGTFEYDAEGRRVSAVIREEGSSGKAEGQARWQFGATPGVDVLAWQVVFDSYQGQGRSVDGQVLRRVDEDGLRAYEEVDQDGDCVPDGAHLFARDRSGTLRIERYTGVLGDRQYLYRGASCPRSAEGSAYGALDYRGMPHLPWAPFGLEPRPRPVDSTRVGLPDLHGVRQAPWMLDLGT